MFRAEGDAMYALGTGRQLDQPSMHLPTWQKSRRKRDGIFHSERIITVVENGKQIVLEGDRAKAGAEIGPCELAEGSVYSGSMYFDLSDTTSMLQLRISLRGVSPPVWRRLLILEEITIADLHHVMQLAMGWNDEHLHQFMIRGWRYGGHREGALQCFDGPDTLSLAAFGLHEHERFAYVYDFSAWWLHDVRVEKRTYNQRSKTLPRCIAGAGRCPPEDTGGPERYMKALEEHGEYEVLEWLETLRENRIEVNELCVQADEWLTWLDRCFDRRAANERLQTLAR